MIGIDIRQPLFYEGTGQYGHAIWPSPVVTIATIIANGDDETVITDNPDLGYAKYVFREDSFDPVTRIRRGRFYTHESGGQPQPWRVQRHPAFAPHVGYKLDTQGYEERLLNGFSPFRFSMVSGPGKKPVVVGLGTRDASTFWRVVGVERISTAEDLVTLKARSNLGVLPELVDEIRNTDGVPVDAKPVQTALNALVDAFHRQQAVPTVDVARETTRVILTAWIGPKARGKDLRDVVSLIPPQKHCTSWAASIVKWLHPRGKSAAHESHADGGTPLRSITDEDAEAAVHLVGLVLREIGWATSY